MPFSLGGSATPRPCGINTALLAPRGQKLHIWTLPASKVALGTGTLFTSYSSTVWAVVRAGNQITKSTAAAGYRLQTHPPPSFAWAVLKLTLQG